MRKSATALSDAALTALRTATITDDGLGCRLPGTPGTPSALPRPVYVEADEALRRAGFKWNRSAKAHVLVDGRRAADTLRELGAIIDTGVALAKNPNAYYPTPPGVAATIAALIVGKAHTLDAYPKLLEPSVGEGALLKAIADRVAPVKRVEWEVSVIDIDAERIAYVKRRFAGRFQFLHCIQRDFLSWEGYADSAPYFDLIAMNPPFDARVGVKHILRAWDLLAPGGRLVSVATPTMPHARELEDLILQHGHVDPLPDKTFAAAGTDVSTVLLRLDKPCS